MAFVYSHIRADNNTIFYIGIGSGEKHYRAYCKQHRNRLWKNIAKNIPYKVEILNDNISWEEACRIERFLIKTYGRIDNKTGVLANCADGGEGMTNPSQETRRKIAVGIGKTISLYNNDKTLFKTFGSLVECASYLKCNKVNLWYVVKGKSHNVKGFYVAYGNEPIIQKITSRKKRRDIGVKRNTYTKKPLKDLLK